MRRCAVSDLLNQRLAHLRRRSFLAGGGVALGAMALAQLARPATGAAEPAERDHARSLQTRMAKSKRVIYLFMHGGPSQIDLFDYKPRLKEWHGEELPPSVRGDQRLTGMTSNQKTKPLVAS